MCGILGFYNKNGLDSNIRTSFLKGLALLNNRGPDYSSYEEIDSTLLGHTRLAIIDLNKEANQPFKFKNYKLIFNGEIYNYKELRVELESKGYQFKTNSDTEVLLIAYDYWKDDCVNHFNGMWAFAIYDYDSKRIFCSRDRFGKKPFFYYFKDGCFIFASEIKSILSFVDSVKVNYNVIAPYITRGIVDFSDETFFNGIKRLLPSQSLDLNLRSNQLSISTYYDILKDKKVFSDDEIFELLEDSIKLRLRSDVKVGVSLSGGLDSSIITSLMNKHYESDLVAIHAKSTIKDNDESKYAKKLTDYLGLKLEIVEPTIEDFLKNIENVIYAQNEPFSSLSIFMQYFVMERASSKGCKVMIDGQGADEVFLGYENYYPMIYKELSSTKNFNKNEFFSNLKLFNTTKEMIEYEANRLDEFELHWEAIKNKGNINNKFLNRELFEKFLKQETIFDNCKSEIFSKRLQALLRYEDRNSMAFGVETRLPFLDYRIVEALLNLPLDCKFRDGYLKHLLRRLMDKTNYMPNSLIWRYNKMGYEAPQKLWIHSYKEEMENDIKDSKIISKFFKKVDIRRDDFLWRLYCLARWEKIFNVQC